MTRSPLSLCGTLFLLSCAPVLAGNRSYDGSGNATGDRGAAHRPLARMSAADYADGLSALAGTTRPNPRFLSNLLCDQTAPAPNTRDGSDYVWQWGQFVDHDLTLAPAETGEDASIVVFSAEDPLHPIIPLTRSDYVVDEFGVRQQVNVLTSFLDGSNVYGSSAAFADTLRAHSGGAMKTAPDGMLPYNTDGLPMAGIGLVSPSELRMAGDVRANEQPGLAAMHTLFVHEHNRLAAEIAAADPSWTDEEVFQRARKIVGALIQSITYNEWLPALLGPAAPDPAAFAYDPVVDPTVSNEFAAALFRIGHTLVSPSMMRIQANDLPDAQASMELKDVFFFPPAIESMAAHEYFLKGLACQLHQNADPQIVSELRQTLFGPPGSGGMDLASLNIQRGREHGLADYNTVRSAYGLAPVSLWAELSSNPAVQAAFASAYSSPDDVDLWIAALSEDHLPGAAVGELIAVSLRAEFTRLAEGDAFFYLWDEDLSPALREEITATTLSQIIARNTSLALQDNVFFISRYPLGFRSVVHRPGVGVELTFMGEPGYTYAVKYGPQPDQITHDLLGEPLSTGNSTYKLKCVDIDALVSTERFYQLVRTPVPE